VISFFQSQKLFTKKNLFVFAVLTFSFFSCSDEEVGPIENENLLPTEFSVLFNLFDGQGIGAATNLNDKTIQK